MKQYLVRFDDPNAGLRHTVIYASDPGHLKKLVKQRLGTATWAGCKYVWALDIMTLPATLLAESNHS